MKNLTLYTYTHKWNEYPPFQCVAPNRNCANGLLTLYVQGLESFEELNCHFTCEEKPIQVAIDREDENEICHKALKYCQKGKKMIYRLIFKDGSVGAWTTNSYYVHASAELCGAKIEVRNLENVVD